MYIVSFMLYVIKGIQSMEAKIKVNSGKKQLNNVVQRLKQTSCNGSLPLARQNFFFLLGGKVQGEGYRESSTFHLFPY